MAENVKLLPNVEQDTMQAAVDELRRTLPKQLEYAALVATLRRQRYEANRKAGFNHEDALWLCTLPDCDIST